MCAASRKHKKGEFVPAPLQGDAIAELASKERGGAPGARGEAANNLSERWRRQRQIPAFSTTLRGQESRALLLLVGSDSSGITPWMMMRSASRSEPVR